MASAEFEIQGLKELIGRLNGAGQRARKEAENELSHIGEEVMAVSQQRVPWDEGTLATSKHVDEPEQEGQTTSVRLGYGGDAAAYALYVHEALEGARSPSPNWSWTKHSMGFIPKHGESYSSAIHWSRPGSGPKYLEQPLNEKKDDIPPRILDAYKNAI